MFSHVFPTHARPVVGASLAVWQVSDPATGWEPIAVYRAPLAAREEAPGDKLQVLSIQELGRR